MASRTPAPQPTPGPWRAIGDTVHATGGQQIADVSFGVRGLANARLMAAAPALRDALDHAVQWGTGYALTGDSTPPWLAEARAALALAAGEPAPMTAELLSPKG